MSSSSDLVGSDAKWDSIVSQGLLIKLSTRQFTILISVFTFAFAFLVARLFRAFSLLLFWMFVRQRQPEPGMEQLRVAVVNFRTPFHVIGEGVCWRMIIVGRKRERRFGLALLVGAVAFLFLGMGLPFTLSLFPVANGFSGGPSCSFGPTENTGEPGFFDAYIRLEQQTALSYTDSMNYDYKGLSAYDVQYLGSQDDIWKSPLCPSHAQPSACRDGDALSFHGQYTITPKDLGVGNLEGLNFTTRVDCYKVIDTERELAPPDVEQLRPLGLFYGPSEVFAESSEPNMTLYIHREEVHGRGYYVSTFSMAEDDDLTGGGQVPWKPREDLRHQGDMSLLIYNLGAVYAFEPGEDSMFATIPLNTSMLPTMNWADQNIEKRKDWNGHQLFKSKRQTVSVICNTTYTLCDEINISKESGHCSRLGGHKKVQEFLERLQNSSNNDKPSVREGFIYLLADIAKYSGMDQSAKVINGVSASDLLLVDFKIQPFLDQISGQRELTRLFLSTRTRFILAARRAVLDEWGYRVIQLGFHANDIDGTMAGNTDLAAMCQATLIPDPNFKTTTAKPWIITACVWFAIICLTYSSPLIRKFRWHWVEDIEQEWSSKKASKLHHQLMESSAGIEMQFKDIRSQNEEERTPSLLERRDRFAHAAQTELQPRSEEVTLIGALEGGIESRGYRSPRDPT
ncbi:hypothetical protein DL95DRAFT_506050 [Leptodontidium sp. 2 PMI_412]|nr:hypothetical protein DL95DRAFT_506050 [Leptodontidium sp. 2 PMI_412]